MSVEVSAAVVSFNTRELTLACLGATERALDGYDATLTLVDNGSADGTPDAVRAARPRWRVLVLPENPGYGAALNRAFAAAPGTFLLALNADVTLEADAVRRLHARLDGHPTCGLAAPALVYPDGRPQPSAKRFPGLGFAVAEALWAHELFPRSRWVRRFYYMDRDLAPEATVDTVTGAAMLIRGEAFRRVGGFDERFWMYFEETDLCRRLRDAGVEVAYCPEARAVHRHAGSTDATSARDVDYYVSYVRFLRKHQGRLAALVLAAALLLHTLVRTLAALLRDPPLSPARRRRLARRLDATRRLLGSLGGVALGDAGGGAGR